MLSTAIKQSQKRRCFYCNEEHITGDIDHFIPDFLSKDKQKFEEIKKELRLPDYFTIDYINSYHNLVYSCSICNQRMKHTRIPDKEYWASRYHFRIKPLIKAKEELEN
jgi:hypothetical protein